MPSGSETTPEPTLSHRLWGVDLVADLPHDLGEGVVAIAPDRARVGAFIAAEVGWASEPAHEPPRPEIARAKQIYLSTLSDTIELHRAGQCVGVLVGAPEDWSTYYVRLFVVSRSAQHRHVILSFIHDCLFAPLRRHGVERVIGDTSPSNRAMNRLFHDLAGVVTGQLLSERWGALSRYTIYLNDAAKARFPERFGGPPPRSRSHS